MHEAKLKHEFEQYKLFWKPFAWLMCQQSNLNRGKKQPLTPDLPQFDPFSDKKAGGGIKRKMNVDRFAAVLGIK